MTVAAVISSTLLSFPRSETLRRIPRVVSSALRLTPVKAAVNEPANVRTIPAGNALHSLAKYVIARLHNSRTATNPLSRAPRRHHIETPFGSLHRILGKHGAR
jgi:hypothetical protein